MTSEFLLSNSNNDLMQIYTNDLNTVIANLNHYIPQFGKFINDILAVQVKYNVTIVEQLGNLSVDVPQDMSQSIQEEVVKKVRVLDSLCLQRSMDIEVEFTKGRSIENLIKLQNPSYKSQISGQIAEFARLKGAFK
jgi:hypothetical protein